MRNRWKKSLILLSVVASTIVIVALVRTPEPTYKGRSIDAWLEDWAAGKRTEYVDALQTIGTNAMPYAIRNLARNDSRWRKKYLEYQPKLPAFLQKLFPDPKPVLRAVDGANVFFYLGTNSIPEAITLLKHPSPTVRQAAAWGIGSVRRQSSAANQAIPALIGALRDGERDVRFQAVLALKEMGADASNAVPALTKVLADVGVGAQTNSYFYLRAAAASALGKIGPAARDALPDLRAALIESNSYLRGQGAVAIWRVSSDVDTALPVLLQEMPTTSEHSKWDWIIALGEMGPRATGAVPQLINELKQDREPWVLEYVTNALIKIDVTAATDAGIESTNVSPANEANNALETNFRPASPLGVWWQFGRAVHAPPCVSGCSRSALR
jgi:HEAT repeat protein